MKTSIFAIGMSAATLAFAWTALADEEAPMVIRDGYYIHMHSNSVKWVTEMRPKLVSPITERVSKIGNTPKIAGSNSPSRMTAMRELRTERANTPKLVYVDTPKIEGEIHEHPHKILAHVDDNPLNKAMRSLE